ncbi:BMC domain-containing protein [Desulforamulus hydrothermalis]|uniref:Microcompartments protein n=1 Tax=Desulforamulus hydrothermalis Lam5 = DSM 18033 TaxID=1121428 RepID=K8E899_9FIRM|nr:BMC domain-containing protein [Desulforamulus hydrothermalis]CCO07728.1 Microcompartments protein [Desulforamulus hydrothermalis Lam5 = DSM 18033]SHH33921.1 BMC domain-containing protein [Desulforamulus hydrothermalis Lam5 = DSM 18033]
MQALGLIETRGLLPAIECADAMLKTAQVELVGRTFVGGGLVTIIVTGDVGAVKAAVEAGSAAVEKIDHTSLIAQHVIPRPHPDIEGMVYDNPLPTQHLAIASTEQVAAGTEGTTSGSVMLKNLHKEGLDALVEEFGLAESINALKLLSVAKLRKLAREYKELGISGRAISKANKDLLIKKLAEYYRQSNK